MKVAVIGIVLQFVIALIMFKIPFVQTVLVWMNSGVAAISSATEAGTGLVFGYLGGNPGEVAYPYAVEDPASTYILAFRVLPMILFDREVSPIDVTAHFRDVIFKGIIPRQEG